MKPADPQGLDGLARLARQARRRAFAPFSRFKVGAALRTRTGEVVTGCNVENASYGLTLCAERVAVFKAVSEGIRGLRPLPADPLGVLRRHHGAHGRPPRAHAHHAPLGAAAVPVRPE